jgi:hypothetical protein
MAMQHDFGRGHHFGQATLSPLTPYIGISATQAEGYPLSKPHAGDSDDPQLW